MDLFKKENSNQELLPPLAERVRPTTLEDFIGQEHIAGEDKILSKALKSGNIFSMILWGPPGSGKTKHKKIIAKNIKAKLYEISAVSSGVNGIRKIIENAKYNRSHGFRTILFIDEIHRFNKAQQDALLHAVEEGKIILIGATTENPSFEVIPPLISRCRVLKLNPLSIENLEKIFYNAISKDIILSKYKIDISKENLKFLLINSTGDARKLLNIIETVYFLINPGGSKSFEITKELIVEALQQRKTLYDKKGDYHYDTISAFIKSIRGSDPDAAIYWLAVMLEGGEDVLFIARRLIILASEDIGNADPNALNVAVSGYNAVHFIGMPEAAIVLAQVTTYLASAPKSNASYLSINRAIEDVKKSDMPNVPLHLRNAPTNLMKSLGYGINYKYPHDYGGHFVKENYFPENTEPKNYYQPSEEGYEKFIKERLLKLWPDRFTKNEKK